MKKFIQEFMPQGQQRAVLYSRVSTGKQEKREISIPDQFREMRGFCERSHIVVIKEFSDAKTGTTMKRPGLEGLLSFVRERSENIDLVMIHSFSRFARDSYNFEGVSRELSEMGVEIVSVTQPVENSPAGKIIRSFLTLIDQQYSEELSKHVTRGMNENARQEFWNGGTPPFGYRAVEAGVRGDTIKKKLCINDIEALDVEMIYRLYLHGDGKEGPLGIKKIVNHLNQSGAIRRGSKWTVGMVHKLLSDRAYIGEFIYGKKRSTSEQIKIPIPDIIDRVEFDNVQRKLKQNNPRRTPPRTVSSPLLLSDLATCGVCGAKMILLTGKSGRYRYYTCSNHKSKGKSVCTGMNVPMPDLDNLAADIAIRHVAHQTRCHSLLKACAERQVARDVVSEERLVSLRRELRDAEAAIGRLYDLVEKGIADPGDAQFATRHETAKNQRDVLVGKIADMARAKENAVILSDECATRFSELLASFIKEGNGSFRRDYLRSVIREIRVNHDGIEVFPAT